MPIPDTLEIEACFYADTKTEASTGPTLEFLTYAMEVLCLLFATGGPCYTILCSRNFQCARVTFVSKS